jgi:hypothetical protein
LSRLSKLCERLHEELVEVDDIEVEGVDHGLVDGRRTLFVYFSRIKRGFNRFETYKETPVQWHSTKSRPASAKKRSG